jgi:predicted DNA-binding transcriptional regulator AlpA
MNLHSLAATLRQVPAEALFPAGWIREHLEDGDAATEVAPPSTCEPEPTWRERLWTAPAETRLGVAELMEALGVSRDWVYGHTSPKRTRDTAAHLRLPHRKLDGALWFLAGEVREWIRATEQVVVRGRAEDSRAQLRVSRGGVR